MKIILRCTLAAIAFSCACNAFAQTWTPTGAPATHWQAVASLSDGRKLITAGYYWTYALSTNFGGTWATNTQPQAGSSFGGWYGLASSADGTKLAAINFTAVWVSTNSGLT